MAEVEVVEVVEVDVFVRRRRSLFVLALLSTSTESSFAVFRSHLPISQHMLKHTEREENDGDKTRRFLFAVVLELRKLCFPVINSIENENLCSLFSSPPACFCSSQN